MGKLLIAVSFGLSLSGLFISGHVFAQEGKVLGTVNGSPIYVQDLNAWVKNAVDESGGKVKDTPELRQQIVNEMVAREVVLSDAKHSGILQKGNMPFKVKFAQQNVVMDVWFNDYFTKHPITEQNIEDEYYRQLEASREGRNSKEYKISQIVLANEADAKAVIAELNAGKSFSALAKEKSIDLDGAKAGGAVDWAQPDNILSPIGDVVINLPKGQYTQEPIKSAGGWRVIRVDDIRTYQFPFYTDAKPYIRDALIQKKKQEAVEAASKRSTIVQGQK